MLVHLDEQLLQNHHIQWLILSSAQRGWTMILTTLMMIDRWVGEWHLEIQLATRTHTQHH